MSLESTTSEESTTSSREGQEDDAISSSSSEDGEKQTKKTKSRNKSHQPALSKVAWSLPYLGNIDAYEKKRLMAFFKMKGILMSMGIIFILLVFTDFLKIVSSTLDIMFMIYEILHAIKNAVIEALELTIKELQNFMKNGCLYYLFFFGMILVLLGLKCGIKRKRLFAIEVRAFHQSNSPNDHNEETTINIKLEEILRINITNRKSVESKNIMGLLQKISRRRGENLKHSTSLSTTTYFRCYIVFLFKFKSKKS